MSSDEEHKTGEHVGARRFAVAWRNRATRERHPVGVLDFEHGRYRFQYLESVERTAQDFRPFIGFPDLERTYESPRLWPFFGLRIMDRKRPDFAQYVRWLGLSEDASSLDILSRSGGDQKGDTVSVAEAPVVATDGSTKAVFLVRGTAYAVGPHRSAGDVASLPPGSELLMVADTENEANAKALLLATSSGVAVGWVPDLLIPYASAARDAGGVVTLLQNNGPEAPWHTRLLVRITARVSPELKFFSGGGWPDRYQSAPV